MSEIISAGGKMVTGTGATTGTSKNMQLLRSNKTFHLVVAGTGAVTAAATIYASNNDIDFLAVATLNASGTTRASDGVVIDATWTSMRVDLTAVTGTGAVAEVFIGG